MSDQVTDSQEMAALEMAATALDAELGALAPEAQMAAMEQAQAVTLADENSQGVRMMLDMAVPMLAAMYPSLEEVYTDDVKAKVAMVLGPVMAKHGVSLKEWGGKYGEEIAAVFVCGPIAMATYKGIRADIEATHARLPGPARPATAAKMVAPDGEVATTASASPGKSLVPGAYGYKEPAEASGLDGHSGL
jgi:hypothetical protein